RRTPVLGKQQRHSSASSISHVQVAEEGDDLKEFRLVSRIRSLSCCPEVHRPARNAEQARDLLECEPRQTANLGDGVARRKRGIGLALLLRHSSRWKRSNRPIGRGRGLPDLERTRTRCAEE